MRRFIFLYFVFACTITAVSAQKKLPKIPIIVSRPDRFVFFPLLVKSPEYKWGLGTGGIIYFKLNDSLARTSNIKLVTFYTLRKQAVFATEGNFFLPGEKYIIHYGASVSRFPDKFWGLGNNTENSAVENYAISQYDLYPQVLREIRKHLFAGVGYEFQKVFRFDYDYREGANLFDREDIAGRNGGKTSGAGIIITWDSRNNAFSASKGFYVQYFNNFYRHFFGSDFNFTMHNLDVRKYFGLKHNQVLAFQFNLMAAQGNIPMRNLSIIGSDSYMRGYYQGRYQDKVMMALQGEFRTPVYKRLGLTLFTGVGRVGTDFEQTFSFTSLKISGGFGLRFAINPKEKLNLRFDTGFGNHSHGSYINMGEAF